MGADEAPNTGSDVQGEQPQGGDFHGLYDLSNTPEEIRPFMEEQLREVSRNVDAKFREAAEFRKQWEPFQNVEGLTEVDPEELQELLQFREIASDPEQFQQWLEAVAQEVGWSPDLDEERWAQIGQEKGWLEEGDGEEGFLDDEGQEMSLDDIVAAVKEAISPDLQSLQEWREQEASQREIQQTEAEMRSQLEALREAHGDFDEDDVITLAMRYAEEDNPIQKGFEHYQRIRGGGQSDLVDEKLGAQNGSALDGGATSAKPPSFKLGDDGLRQAAAARFAQAS